MAKISLFFFFLKHQSVLETVYAAVSDDLGVSTFPSAHDMRLFAFTVPFKSKLTLDSRFAQEWRITNRVENRDSQRTVNLLLNGAVQWSAASGVLA